jgi:hypothetical protein
MSKSSEGSLKNSSSSLVEPFAFRRYRDMNDFWGDPSMGSASVDADGGGDDGGVGL